MAVDQVKNVVINVQANTKGIKDLTKEIDKLQKENKQMANSFKDANTKMQAQTKKTKSVNCTNKTWIPSSLFPYCSI